MALDFDFFKVEKVHAVPCKGKLLISEPFLNDDYFKRSIVFLTEHTTEGSVGFILNKPIDTTIDGLLKNFPKIDVSVSLGGPVATDSVHYLHTLGDIIPKSIHVTGDLYWGGEFDAVLEMAKLGALNKNRIRFFLGYSGWQADQLAGEIELDSWVVADVSPARVLAIGKPESWKEMLSQRADKYKLWANFPEDPYTN